MKLKMSELDRFKFGLLVDDFAKPMEFLRSKSTLSTPLKKTNQT